MYVVKARMLVKVSTFFLKFSIFLVILFKNSLRHFVTLLTLTKYSSTINLKKDYHFWLAG